MNITKYKITIGAVALNLILAFFTFGQTPNATDIRPLPLNKTVEREIKAAEEHFYLIKLKEGEVLRLELDEGQVVNYVFRLIKESDGQTISESDLTTTFGRESITYIASTKESLKVLVKAPEKISGSAKYKLTVTKLKKATETDKERIKAEELSKEAAKLSKDAPKLPEGNRTESYRKAVKLAEEALNLRRKQADKYWEGWTLTFLGNLYSKLRDKQKALNYYNQTLQVIKSNNKIVEANILTNIAKIYSDLNETSKAIDNYNQALEIFRELKDREREDNTLGDLGFFYFFKLNQYEKALQYYQQSLAISQEIKDYQSEAQKLLIISSLLYPFLKQTEKAQEALEQALTIYRKANNKTGEIRVLGQSARVYGLSDSSKAIQYLEQALAINRELNDKKGEISTLNEISGYYLQLRKFGKALQYYERSLSIAREIKDRNLELNILASIGDLYVELKNYEMAREYYEKATLTVPQQKDIIVIDNRLIFLRLARIYQQLKQYEKAKEYYEKELDLLSKERNQFSIGFTLSNLADLYNEQKKYEKAREYIEKAAAFFRENNNSIIGGFTGGFSLITLGEFYQKQKQYDKAREYFEQSLAISRESKFPNAESGPIFLLGKLYLEQKQYEKARTYLEQAIAKMREANLLQQTDIAIFPAMVDLYEGLKNPQLAIFYGKQQINIYQNVRTEIKTFDKDTQLSFVKDKEPAYRKLADLLISEGRLPEAQAVLDLLKEEEFRNFTGRRSGEIPDTVPYSKTESEVAAKVENLAKLEQERAELLKQKEQGSLPADKQSRLNQIPIEIETANKAFRLALDALGKSEASSVDRVAEIQSEKSLQRTLTTLGKETKTGVVALYTLLGTEENKDATNKPKTKFGWIILVTPTARKAYPIDVTDLEQTVFAFRDVLQSDKYDPKPLAQKLYQKLFRQTSPKQKTTLEADLEILLGGSKDKTLMWSLDGILRYVPMAALHDGKGYLVEKYRSVIFTKESFLTLTEKDTANWQALGLGVSEKREGFDSLPGAERELKDVVRDANNKTGILDGKIKLNKDFAEEETLRLWREGSFQVVHIASHYSFNATDPTSSFLLVGDGRLSFSEMQDKDNLFGSVDLLTLSACDTAMTSNGKEAEGFAYLAQSLGAKSVIASLWKVSDAGTPELMIRFYKLRTENPSISKGEAFRLAQLSLLGSETASVKTFNSRRSEIVNLSGKKTELPIYEKTDKSPFAHPHYWSSFILIGNWR